MTALAWLVPIALLLGGLGLMGFLWSLKSGQFDDLQGAGWRALDDESELRPAPVAAKVSATGTPRRITGNAQERSQ